jgi:hypothetical protein
MIWQELAIGRSELGTTRPLASGGQGRIFRVPDLYLPDAPVPLVYKEYLPSGPPVSPAGLANIIALRAPLRPEQKLWFDSHLAWPLRIVVDREQGGDTAIGVVMRLIPADFFQTVTLNGEKREVARESRYLFGDRAGASQLSLAYPDLATRRLLCLRLAYLIAFLHRHEIVFGDVSSRNILYRLTPTPDVLLVDCDAVRKVGSAAVVPQGHSPEFMPPDPYEPQSVATDLFKMGIYIVRVLAPGVRVTLEQAGEVGDAVLDATGARMLRASIGADPAGRPAALEWYRYFRSLTAGQSPA